MVLRPHGHRRLGRRHLAHLSAGPQRRRASPGQAPRRAAAPRRSIPPSSAGASGPCSLAPSRPPPMPASAFVMVAGALRYPWHRFLLGVDPRTPAPLWPHCLDHRALRQPHLPLAPRLLPPRTLDPRHHWHHRCSRRTLVLYPRTPTTHRYDRSAGAPRGIACASYLRGDAGWF